MRGVIPFPVMLIRESLERVSHFPPTSSMCHIVGQMPSDAMAPIGGEKRSKTRKARGQDICDTPYHVHVPDPPTDGPTERVGLVAGRAPTSQPFSSSGAGLATLIPSRRTGCETHVHRPRRPSSDLRSCDHGGRWRGRPSRSQAGRESDGCQPRSRGGERRGGERRGGERERERE